MRALLILSVTVLLGTGCSTGQEPAANASPSARPPAVSPPPGARVVPGGCGSTKVFEDSVPAWIDVATAHNTPRVPYVLAVEGTAVGLIFVSPMRAGHPENPSNKVIWAVRVLRDRSSLEITGHPLGATSPSIRQTVQAGVPAEGNIYRSIVDVPNPGCWHFDLSWNGQHAAVELEYQ